MTKLRDSKLILHIYKIQVLEQQDQHNNVKYPELILENKIEWIQNWYKSNCIEAWAEEFGIKIETLDNPGWIVRIDLLGTDLENKSFTEVDERNRSDTDWLHCSIKEWQFVGAGGVQNLDEILGVFIKWVESHG